VWSLFLSATRFRVVFLTPASTRSSSDASIRHDTLLTRRVRRYISQLFPFVFVACFSGDAVGVSLIGEPYLNRPARVVGRFGIAATSEM
jgi:hypothetical protein